MTSEQRVPCSIQALHLHRPFTVAGIRSENHCTQTLVFRESLPAQPGQFVMAWLPGVGEKPFSLAAADPLALTIVAVGPFSRATHRLSVGDPLPCGSRQKMALWGAGDW